MKINNIRAIALIFIAFLFQQCIESDTSSQKNVLHGSHIKSCKIYSCNYADNDSIDNEILIEEFEYDKYGNETKLIRYDTLGNISCSFSYKYDNQGNLSEKIWKEAAQIKKSNNDVAIVDDFNNYNQESISKEEGNVKNNQYDKSGKLVEQIWNDPYTKSKIKETHQYFEDGKTKEVYYYDKSKNIQRRDIFTYDSVGNETAIQTYDSLNVLIDKITYSYDQYGNVIQDVYWNSVTNKPKQSIKYTYEYY